QGVSVYLDRVPDRAELALYEVAPGTSTVLGRELARGKAVGADENGLTAFTFDAITGSAGKRYAFVLTCPGCAEERVPRLVVGHSVDQPGDLLDRGRLHLDPAAALAGRGITAGTLLSLAVLAVRRRRAAGLPLRPVAAAEAAAARRQARLPAPSAISPPAPRPRIRPRPKFAPPDAALPRDPP